jgi:hypothetical protein
MIESTSSERGFEADFTEVLRNEFISRGRVSIKGMDNAQMVLIKVQVYDVMTGLWPMIQPEQRFQAIRLSMRQQEEDV